MIIPTVGAFLAHEEPAHYNAEEHIFMPPYRTMHFTPRITADDELLVSEYINHGHMQYEEATGEMKKDIAALRQALAQNSVARLGELGTFYMNINGEISFEVDANGIDDPCNFGFEPFAIPLLRECEEKKIVIKRRDLGQYIAAAVAIILTFIFVTPISDSAYKQNMQASFTGFASSEQISLMQQLSATAPVATADVTDYEITPLDENGRMCPLPAEEPAAPAEVTETPAQSEPAPVAEPAPAVQVQETTYHIIVASSPNESNARLAIEELSAKMQASYSVVKGGGRHRISIGEYSTNKEAQEAVKELKSTFPDAWILPTNNQ